MPLTFEEFIKKYKNQKWNVVHSFQSVESKTCKKCDYYVPICVYCNLSKYCCQFANQLLEEKINIEETKKENQKTFLPYKK